MVCLRSHANFHKRASLSIVECNGVYIFHARGLSGYSPSPWERRWRSEEEEAIPLISVLASFYPLCRSDIKEALGNILWPLPGHSDGFDENWGRGNVWIQGLHNHNILRKFPQRSHRAIIVFIPDSASSEPLVWRPFIFRAPRPIRLWGSVHPTTTEPRYLPSLVLLCGTEQFSGFHPTQQLRACWHSSFQMMYQWGI